MSPRPEREDTAARVTGGKLTWKRVAGYLALLLAGLVGGKAAPDVLDANDRTAAHAPDHATATDLERVRGDVIELKRRADEAERDAKAMRDKLEQIRADVSWIRGLLENGDRRRTRPDGY